MTWDGIVDIKRALDDYSKATGIAYLFIVAQGNDSTARVISKAMGAMPDGCGPAVFFALDEAAGDIFEEMAEHFGIEPDPDA